MGGLLALPRRVARVAGRRVVPVPGAARVLGVHLRPGVARRAGEHLVVVRIEMAFRAGPPGVPPGRDREPRVIEPALVERRVGVPVARLARRREPRRPVVRVRRAVVLRLVARDSTRAACPGRRCSCGTNCTPPTGGARPARRTGCGRNSPTTSKTRRCGTTRTPSGSRPRRGSGWSCARSWSGGSRSSRAACPCRRCSCGTPRRPASRARRRAGRRQLWLNVARQFASEARWHDSHVVGKPAAAWFGLVVRS